MYSRISRLRRSPSTFAPVRKTQQLFPGRVCLHGGRAAFAQPPTSVKGNLTYDANARHEKLCLHALPGQRSLGVVATPGPTADPPLPFPSLQNFPSLVAFEKPIIRRKSSRHNSRSSIGAMIAAATIEETHTQTGLASWPPRFCLQKPQVLRLFRALKASVRFYRAEPSCDVSVSCPQSCKAAQKDTCGIVGGWECVARRSRPRWAPATPPCPTASLQCPASSLSSCSSRRTR
jgi:hypothetical protein